MKKNRSQCKRYAKEVLRGNFTIPIVGTLAVAGMSFIGSTLATALFPGDSLYAILAGEVFNFVLSLIICVFSAGLYRIYLNISRHEEYSFGDLLYFFRNQPDRVIVASFVLALINLVTSIPSSYFAMTTDMGTTVDEQMNWMMGYFVLMIVCYVLNIVVASPFAFTYYVLSDRSEAGGFEALKISARLMKKHWLKYFAMLLSFVPWIIFSVFTMYLVLLWLVPYIEMSLVVFYRDIAGDFDEPVLSENPQITDQTEA